MPPGRALSEVPRTGVFRESSRAPLSVVEGQPAGTSGNPDPSGIGVATVLPGLAVERAKIELKKIRADLERTRTELLAARDLEKDTARKADESREKIEALERAKTELESRAERETSDLKQQIQALSGSKAELESRTSQEISGLREEMRTLDDSKKQTRIGNGNRNCLPEENDRAIGEIGPGISPKIRGKRRGTQAEDLGGRRERSELEEQESQLDEILRKLDRARAEAFSMDTDLREKHGESGRLRSEIEKATAEASVLVADLGKARGIGASRFRNRESQSGGVRFGGRPREKARRVEAGRRGDRESQSKSRFRGCFRGFFAKPKVERRSDFDARGGTFTRGSAAVRIGGTRRPSGADQRR